MEPLQRSPTLRFVRRLFPLAPPAIEVELTARLFGGSGAIAILGIVTGATAVQATLNRDPFAGGLLFAIAIVSLARLLHIRRLRERYGPQPPDLAAARRWERSYAVGSVVSSFALGICILWTLSYRDAPLAMLAIGGLCSYVFSIILRTAVRPLVCLPSVAMTLLPGLSGLPLFLHESRRLDPTFAAAALTTVAALMTLSCVQLSSHLYRMTLNQLLAQRDLLRFARQDPLTGLDNRLTLRERFEELAPGPTRPAALLYLDLDGFKPVNDVHGHQTGDALLREVAARLSACVRPGDGVFRVGGDEFVVLLARVRERLETTATARQLVASLGEPYALPHATVRIGASIGIAVADAPNADLDDLTAAADAALYDAKRSGRGTFRFAKDESSLRLIA